MSNRHYAILGENGDEEIKLSTQAADINEALSILESKLKSDEGIGDDEEFHPMGEPIINYIVSSSTPLIITDAEDYKQHVADSIDPDELAEAQYIAALVVNDHYEQSGQKSDSTDSLRARISLASQIAKTFVSSGKMTDDSDENMDSLESYALDVIIARGSVRLR